ncbi:MAG: Hsp70 family protein [Desulfatitalea sp.]|nr:Hsp70 family protein [Desulfatitalea sp.]NNK01295.1 Hsp70 family protein [Desulfatitalea sp.]
MGTIIGIDLGTTNSEVAIVRDGRPEIIAVDGERIMPSCVGIDDQGKLLVGRTAKNRMAMAPDQTVLSIKRKMGLAEKVGLGDGTYSPEEVSALILAKLKSAAEAHLGEPITETVITVPAYFDDAQRKATQNAGTLAGLNVRRIINEPTAAALAYDTDHSVDRTVLVYDLGGGTFDASLVVVQGGVVEVKASHGDTHLGGDDFDQLLMEHVDNTFFEAHGVRPLAEPKAANRLWATVEKAKRELSNAPFARLREEYLTGEHHLDMEINRIDYEEMIRPLIQKTLDSVHRCFKDAAILPGALDKVILVGGASRTPLVAKMIREKLNIEPHQGVDPDLIVAMGAAIQAAVLDGVATDSVLVDITPYTFGTSAGGNYNGEWHPKIFVPLIHRGTTLPTKKGECFYTMQDSQEAVDVRIFQGEEPLAEENIFIGNFLVEGLSEVPAGNEIVISLALDLNGVLEVTALEKRSGLSKTVTMETVNGTAAFDIQKAQENLKDWITPCDPADDTPPEADTETIRVHVITEAKTLRKRSLALMDGIDETDAGELQALLADSQKAIADGHIDRLRQFNESLNDMLFYLED